MPYAVRTDVAASLTALVRRLPRSPGLPSWASSTLAQLDEGYPVPKERVVEAVVAALAASAPFGWIADRAHGNPLFALEYLRYLSRQGYLWSDGRSRDAESRAHGGAGVGRAG
jgi:hypothetical protein